MFERKLVVDARLETKRLVEVAEVVVEFVAVKSCKVEDPFTKRLLKDPKVDVRRPMKLVLALKLVVEARLEIYRLVDVAFVVVALVPEKFVLVRVVIVEEAPRTELAT